MFIIWICHQLTSLKMVSTFEDRWIAYHVDIDQRQGKIRQYLYQIEEDRYGKTDNMEIIIKNESDFKTSQFDIEDTNARILASDMSITNIRLYNDVIEEKYHSKVLLSNIIGDDSRHLIFADNANIEMTLLNMGLSDLNLKILIKKNRYTKVYLFFYIH